MKPLHPLRSVLLASGLLATSIFSAQATIGYSANEAPVSVGNYSTNVYMENISNSDLLEAGSPYLTSVTAPVAASSGSTDFGSVAGLNDGIGLSTNVAPYTGSTYYGYNLSKGSLIVDSSLAGGGAVVTFNLNTTANPNGYDINGVNTFAGWSDHASVSNQIYTLSYSTVSNPTVFIPVYSVTYDPNNPLDDSTSSGGFISEVSLTNLDLSNVAALQFDFLPYPGSSESDNSANGIWLQEIDAFGTVPEPATWAMLGLGLAALVVVTRFRFARA